MSLQVWLPLNGDLHNQGLSDVTVTNNGATVNTSGKIGKCYSFDGSNSCIALNAPSLYNIIKGGNQPFTIMFWIYHAAASRGIIFGDYGLTGTIQCNVELQSNHKVRFYWAGAPDKNFSTSVGENTWCHIALVYDGSQVIIYKNGVLQTGDSYSGTLTAKSKTTGVYHLGRDYRNDTNLNGKLNDFRIYDHVLSTKEVEEISQGLVLHYKLDQPNQNLLTNDWDLTAWSKESGISVSWDNTIGMYKVLDSSHTSSRWGIYQNITLSANTTYTFSVDGMKKDQNVNFGFAEGTSWPANAGSFTTTMSRLSKTITVGDADANCRIYLNINPVTDGSNYGYFRAPKLEIGSVATNWKAHTENIIYDSSGYSNNGTIVGSLTTSTPSPRYSCATKFDGASRITHDTLPSIYTLSCWCKTDKNKSTSQFMVADSGSSMCISFYNGTIIGVFGTIRSTGSKCTLGSEYKENDWNHIVVVKTSEDGQRDIYCNGVKLTPTSNNYWNATTGFWVGTRDASQTNPFYGNIVDVRAYATALTPEQIKELYNTSMSIDNKGNIHARELIVEDTNNISTNKRGQLLVNTAEEDTAIASFIKPNKIECDNLYEY